MKHLYGFCTLSIAAILPIITAQKLTSCLEGGFSIEFDGECNLENFLQGYRELFEYTLCDHTLDKDIRLKLGLPIDASDADLTAEVKSICEIAWKNSKKTPYAYTHNKDDQFEQLYYNGGTYWNEEVETLLETGERTNHLRTDAAVVRQFYNSRGQTAPLEWPGNLPNFDLETCEINAAMCCWPQDRQANDGNGNCDDPYDEKCYDKDPADNTDLCYVDLSRSLEGNRLNSSGHIIFPHDNSNGEGAIHCHGFAWANDEGDFTSRFKANNLFYVSMYDHMHQRGYVRNIPGAPMCACVEQMPTVTRSDCTQIDVKEKYKIVHIPDMNRFSAEITDIEIDFNSCRGRYNRNNDLHAYVARLTAEGKLRNDQRAGLDKYIVGNGRCREATSYEMSEKGYMPGFYHDDNAWFKVAGSNTLYARTIGREAFRALLAESPEPKIIWRVCATCVPSHQHIYYRRYKEVPEDFNLLNALLNSWSNLNNVQDTDFRLFSTYEDAVNNENPWTFYSFHGDRGFPYESGPRGKVRDQWRTFSKYSGKRDVAFYVLRSPGGGIERYDNDGSMTGANIGSPYRGGEVLTKDGTFYITAAGNDIWSYQDQFYFLHEETSGDLTLKVHVSKLNKKSDWTKAGIMIRDTLQPNSANVLCMHTGGKGVVTQWRSEAGKITVNSGSSNGIFRSGWIMLTKRGNIFTCSKSDDGDNWIRVGKHVSVELGETVYAGMALTSNKYNQLAEAVFEEYEIESYYYPSASPTVSRSPNFVPDALVGCGSRDKIGECGKEMDIVSKFSQHAVRCCSDFAKPDWVKNDGCNVWGESEINGQCIDHATYEEAAYHCSAANARLCTINEIGIGCTESSGCGFDEHLVWASGSIPNADDEEAYVACGNPERISDCGKPFGTESKFLPHAVRCCSDSAKPDWVKHDGCAVWGESDISGQCFGFVTYDEAVELCSSVDARLCTLSEVAGGCTSESGCGHDDDLVWASGRTPNDDDEKAVVGCGNLKRVGDCGAAFDTVSKFSPHAVRCCSDSAKLGWVKKSSCDVWGESDINEQCLEYASYDEAVEHCYSADARLCTVDELVGGCTAESGCYFDDNLVWASGSIPNLDEEKVVGCGNPDRISDCGKPVDIVPMSSLHAVRCCSDSSKSGWVKNSGCVVWGESDINEQCIDEVTYGDAVEHCSAVNARLCTLSEVAGGCTSGSGCGFDSELVWVSGFL
jgi:regulation of enolase protein 1 (concanavalin A-like superfamily)